MLTSSHSYKLCFNKCLRGVTFFVNYFLFRVEKSICRHNRGCIPVPWIGFDNEQNKLSRFCHFGTINNTWNETKLVPNSLKSNISPAIFWPAWSQPSAAKVAIPFERAWRNPRTTLLFLSLPLGWRQDVTKRPIYEIKMIQWEPARQGKNKSCRFQEMMIFAWAFSVPEVSALSLVFPPPNQKFAHNETHALPCISFLVKRAHPDHSFAYV